MELIILLSLSLVHLSLLQGADAAAQQLIVTSGSSATFYCSLSTDRTLNIKRCECSNSRICSKANQSRMKIQEDRTQWRITLDDLTPSDSGSYYDWNLTVLSEKDPSVVIGKSGGSAVMSCLFGEKASASEKYWCREDQHGSCLRISLGDTLGRFHIEDPQGTFSLVKHDLSPEDSGKYRCVVNQERTSSHTIDLQVLQNENGLSAPRTVNVLPGKNITVACKYIQEYVKTSKTWERECSWEQCSYFAKVTDDRTRSELVLSIENVRWWYNKDIYTFNVKKSDGVVSKVSVTLMVGVTAPEHVNGTKGGNVEIHCNYSSDGYYNIRIFWCKPGSDGICNHNIERVTIEDFSSYFVVTMKHLEMNDAGLYQCGYTYRGSNDIVVSADVHLSVVEPQVFTTPSAVMKKGSTRRPIKINNNLGSNSLLFGIFFLLSVIAISLLIILLKLYCKRHSDRVQTPDLGGGTFHMNDLKNNIHLLSPDLPINQQPYTGTMDDSSSTSSESSGHSFGNISFGARPQYLTIIPSPINLDYENVSAEMHPALSDYENVTTDIEQDYVNVPEAPNSSFTEDKECESCQPTETCDENDNTSESSSDESDEESVNYSTVVFAKTTE